MCIEVVLETEVGLSNGRFTSAGWRHLPPICAAGLFPPQKKR
jgi:hypothetical protein